MTGPTTTAVVIGVGNAFRRDDGVGHATTESLRRCTPRATGVVVTDLDGEATRLIDAWDGADVAMVIDAMCSGAEPGAVERVEIDPRATDAPLRLPTPARSSTHAVGVGEALALGRALDRLPRRLVVYAVEGAEFGAGPGLSAAVEAAVEQVAGRIRRELSW
jgi:hydrogenase maturation protease